MIDSKKRYKVHYERYWGLKKALGLTQQDIADGLKVPRLRVNQIINGHRTCPADLAQAWADLFGVAIKELFEAAEQPAEIPSE